MTTGNVGGSPGLEDSQTLVWVDCLGEGLSGQPL